MGVALSWQFGMRLCSGPLPSKPESRFESVSFRAFQIIFQTPFRRSVNRSFVPKNLKTECPNDRSQKSTLMGQIMIARHYHLIEYDPRYIKCIWDVALVDVCIATIYNLKIKPSGPYQNQK